MKIILVHDSFTQNGGAERVVRAMHEAFPEAPVYTLVHDKKTYGDTGFPVRTSWLQYIHNLHPNFKHMLALLPLAVWSQKIPQCDVVISSSSLFYKGLTVPYSAKHIAYCHTPVRFLWTEPGYVKQEVPLLLRPLVKLILKYFKKWDRDAAQKPTAFIANSKEVQKRIKEYYGRDSEVIYPFVDMGFWHPTSPSLREGVSAEGGSVVGTTADRSNPSANDEIASMRLRDANSAPRNDGRKKDYFLLGGRLQAHKDNELVIQLFNKLGLPLRVFGSGSQEWYLKSIAKPNIVFLGRISDEQLRDQYSSAKAFIYPQFEDFGQMPLEAAACGTPTIGLNRGGTLETVVPGVTGELFDGTEDSLEKLVTAWNDSKYQQGNLLAQAEKFSKEVFIESITKFVREHVTRNT